MKVVAGNFRNGTVWVIRTIWGRPKRLGFPKTLMSYDKIPLSQVASFRLSDREKAKSWMSKLGWGAAIGMVLGPAGALGAMLGAGNKDDAVAEVILDDGRKALVTGATKELREIERLVFTLQSTRPISSTSQQAGV